MCVSKFAELVLSVVVEHDPVTADIAIATKKERKHKHEQIIITIKCLNNMMQYQPLMRLQFLVFYYTVAVTLSITLQGSNYTLGVKTTLT